MPIKNIFISHVPEDHHFVDWMTHQFHGMGVEYWCKDVAHGGEAYYNLLDQKMDSATDFMVVCSPWSVDSGEIYQELQSAILAGKNIVIVRLENFEPPPRWRYLLKHIDFQLIQPAEIPAIFMFPDQPESRPTDWEEMLEDAPATADEGPYRSLQTGGEGGGGSHAGTEKSVDDGGKDEEVEIVQFTTYHPREIAPSQWYKLLIYIYLSSAEEAIKEDSRAQLGEAAKDYGKGRGRATETILREAEITIVPEMPGCRFNPPQQTVMWLEDWHRADFRMQTDPQAPGFEADSTLTGRVAFYVGPILVAETKIATYVTEDADEVMADRLKDVSTTEPYRDIFISYSHKDNEIIEQVEKAVATLGDKLLRDVRDLRSGEEWNPALLQMIEKANIFQLFWSNNSKISPYVEQEWRHALAQDKPYFIRPLFWEDPMPSPPPELRHIHFERYEL